MDSRFRWNDNTMKKPKKTKEPFSLVPITPTEQLPATIDPLHQYLREVSQFPLLSKEEETKTAAHYIKHQDKESAQKLVVSNLRLVVKIALEYQRAFHNILDLIQEGNMGLMRAVTKYDAAKGTRFSYYASWWIRAYILKYIVDNFRLVKIGTTQAQKKLFYNLMKEKKKIEAMGFSPQSALLSETLNVKEKEVIEMEQRMGAPDMALDAPARGYEDKLNLDFFTSDIPAQDVTIEQNDLKKKLFENLGEFLSGLKDKERKIFKDRLYVEVPKTLQDIADHYGISRERVRQIEENVIKKLKEFFNKKGLTETSG